MTRHPFRLEAVLRIRRIQEESARHQLFVQHRHLQSQLEGLAAAEVRYKSLPISHGPVPPDTFRRERAAADLGAAAQANAGAAVASARIDAGTAHRLWSEAAMRVEALDRLARRWTEDERALAARRETATIDDLITSRWVAPLTLAAFDSTHQVPSVAGDRS